jgi:SNF2 family DNA or RNA helicase
VLVISKLALIYEVWPREIKKWEEFHHLTYRILHGRHKDKVLEDSRATIDLVNSEGLEWLVKRVDLSTYDVLIVDESRDFANSQTKRFKLLKPWLSFFKRRWILTGTPMPNGLMDLFGQIYILDMGRALGRYITHYRNEFFFPTGYGGYEWTAKEGSYLKIIDRVSPLVIRLKAEDHLKMPDKVLVNYDVNLSKEVMSKYKQVEDEYFLELDQGTIVAGTGAVAGVKCRQIANGAVYAEDGNPIEIHSAKLDALENLLEEIGNASVLILYEFIHDADRIQQRVPGLEILGGGVSAAQRESMVRRFNDGSLTRLAGHPKSMGHGLNLQGACYHVIWFGIPWDLDHYDQANARIYRQGQTAPAVLVYHLVARHTLDEEVIQVLQSKDRTQQNLLLALSEHRRRTYDVP